MFKLVARLGRAVCNTAVNKENLKQTSTTGNKIYNNIIARLNLTYVVGGLTKFSFFSILELLPVVLYDSTIFQSSELSFRFTIRYSSSSPLISSGTAR